MSAGRKQRWLNTAWVPHRLELIVSPAWQVIPRPLQRVIERLEIEHMRHGGFENGQLFVSYEQFVKYGVSRRVIRPVLELGEALKLVVIAKTDEIGASNVRPPNAYGLTYLPIKGRSQPGDDWKRVSEQQAAKALEIYKTATASSAGSAGEEPNQQGKRNAA
jgi:hypothetical protein